MNFYYSFPVVGGGENGLVVKALDSELSDPGSKLESADRLNPGTLGHECLPVLG